MASGAGDSGERDGHFDIAAGGIGIRAHLVRLVDDTLGHRTVHARHLDQQLEVACAR
jgi:hypothetical protein